MSNLRTSIALLMLMLMGCAFIEMFTPGIKNEAMIFLMTTFTGAGVIATIALYADRKYK